MSCLGNIENDIGRDRDVTHPAALLCYHPKYFHTYTRNHIHSYIYKYIHIHRERERGIDIYIYNINNIYIARTSTHAVAPHHYLLPYIYTYIYIHIFIYTLKNMYTVCYMRITYIRSVLQGSFAKETYIRTEWSIDQRRRSSSLSSTVPSLRWNDINICEWHRRM